MNAPSNIAKRRMNALADGSADYKAKRDELVLIAAKLFKDKGFKATTLNDLAKEAGVERASLYYYISSKDELIQEVIRGVTDANAAAASKIIRMKSLGPEEKLRRLVEVVMTSYEENYPHMYVYIQEQMHEVEYSKTPWAKQMVRQTRRIEMMFMNLMVEGIEAGIFRSDIPARLAANGLFGMLNWTHRWFKPGGKQTAKEISDAFCSLFFDGMRQKPN